MPAKKDNLLTGKLFRITFASFFVANIMTVLGTVIDGFVASNALDRASIAATGLVSPVIILFTVIGTIAGIGFQVRSLKCLGKGDTEGAGRALSETMITGLVLSVLLMAFALIRPDVLVRFIGVSENSAEFSGCIDYIRGTAIGIPALTAMAILTRGVQIDGAHKIAVLSVIVMAVTNIVGDYIVVAWLNAGLYGLSLDTSVSYYAGTLVLLWYCRRPDFLIRPVLKGISLIETLKVNNIGVWGGALSLLYGLTLVLRADILNVAMDLFKVGEAGLQAYHVQVQMNYIVNASQSSAISMLFLFGGLCTAEEDRISFKKIVGKVVKYDVLTAAAMSAILFFFAGIIARLYLRGADAELLATAAGVLMASSVGLVFQIVVILFANYIQVFNHNIVSAFVIIVINFFAPLFGASFGGALGEEMSTSVIVCIFSGVSVCYILSALLLPLLVPLVNRRIRGRDLLWMIPENYGVAPENELRAMITTQDDVMEFSQKAWDFCKARGMSERTSYLTSLAIEEMATNVVKHGFARDDRDHTLSVRLVVKDDELILRFRDDSPGFDPRSKYDAIFNNPDISRMIGLKMILTKAREVSYTSMFSLNNLIIRIGNEAA